MDNELTAVEALQFLQLPKRRVDDGPWALPPQGRRLTVDLVSLDGREQFKLDMYRGRISLEKGVHQTRARTTVVLVRLCFGGRPHTNPNGETVGPYHFHQYRPGYGDKWAFEPSAVQFADLLDSWRRLEDFLRFCNVVGGPSQERELLTWRRN